tara:strand:- start:5843 stop:6232 length:390 start_codon:yes stop_codon:yes gene_type:complete
MKKLVILFSFILLSLTTFSQVVDDSTTISNQELEEVFKAIDTLVQQDSLKTVLINDLKTQINLYQSLSSQDSILLGYKDKQIGILNETINLYDDRLKKVDKWYNKPWVGFILGCATITTSSWIVKNVID